MNTAGTISAKVFEMRNTFRAEHSKLVIFCDRQFTSDSRFQIWRSFVIFYVILKMFNIF
jgi:hypothetical protein